MTSAPPPIALRVGDTLGGKLLLEAELGRGGMGLVFQARHLQFDERVAVKVLLPTTSKRAAARFDREIRASMRMRGEHTVRVLDAGREGDCPYLVMEFLEGCDLRGLLAQRGPLPCDEVVGYLLQACEGISEAHSLGVVHRDLKPANLFLTRRFDGTPQIKVLDFGVAKALLDEPSDDVLTSSSTSIGTPMYMAPEQIRDAKRVDERADIWSLGVVLFELWTGRTPFSADTAQGLLAAILSEEPLAVSELRPDTPPALAQAIERCLRRAPAQRHETIRELASALAPLAPPWASTSVLRLTAPPAAVPPPASPGADLPPGLLSTTEEASAQLLTSGYPPEPVASAANPRARSSLLVAALLACVGGLAALRSGSSVTHPTQPPAEHASASPPLSSLAASVPAASAGASAGAAVSAASSALAAVSAASSASASAALAAVSAGAAAGASASASGPAFAASSAPSSAAGGKARRAPEAPRASGGSEMDRAIESRN